MLSLRPYQEQCLEAISDARESGFNRQLVSLPTGTGKTIIFCHLLKDFGRVLILAHRDELCQQAIDKLLMVYPEAEKKIGIVKAQRNDTDKPIIVGSVQTVSRDNRLEDMPESFDLVITDEAHHAVADSYRRIYDKLVNGNLHVGFTATPNRTDNIGLGEVYDEVVFERTIKDMIKAGWLCSLSGNRITTDVSLDGVNTVRGDFSKKALTSVINTENRNQLIVKSWLEHASERKTLAFTVDVQHAHDLAEAFLEAGIPASPISGNTPDSKRHELERKFHTSEIQVLCNCNLLTEGYDEPAIDCILLARPTKSQSLYIQMVGRGTRIHPGKKDCLILDVVDNTTRHDIRQFADLGLVPEESEGIANQAAEGEKDRFKDLGFGEDIYSEEIDILGKAARFDWNILDSDTFKLYIGDGYIKVGMRSDGEGYYAYFKQHGESLRFLTPKHKVNLSWAIGIAEDFASSHLNGDLTLISKQSEWKKEPATEKQLNILNSFGIDYDYDITKGEASKLIDRAYYQQR